MTIRLKKGTLLFCLKVFTIMGLSLISVNTWSCSPFYNDAYAYVGNPLRPNTIWVPAHYEKGCWVEGYYINRTYALTA